MNRRYDLRINDEIAQPQVVDPYSKIGLYGPVVFPHKFSGRDLYQMENH